MLKSKIKPLALLLVLVLSVFSFSACGETENDTNESVKYSEPLYYAEDDTFGYTIYDDHAELTKFFGASTLEVTIPSEVDDTKEGVKKPLTVIGKGAFCANTGAQTLNIPDSVVEIHSGAFHDCTGIEIINFGNGLKAIGTSAFSNCMSINELNFPKSLEYIGDYAFSGCSTIAKLDLSNVKKIGDNAFEKCISIEEIAGGDELSLAGSNILSDTPWYEKQTDKFVTIGKALVKYNGNEGAVELDEKIEGVSNVFAGREDLLKINMPSVKFVCNNAFSGCANLSDVTISDNAEFIGCNAFSDTPYFSSLKADENGFTIIGKVLVKYSGEEKSLRIPDGIKMISNAFEGNTTLSDISTGASVETIGSDAFTGCTELKTLVVGENVSFIDNSALYDITVTEFNAGSNSYAAYWAKNNGLSNILFE